ncbi:Integral membrane protein OS=Tsukamurella paurometabola (strain ATCC 8368 / DSM / CCUG 35730/ CIP 100753 / JCM 10117 / KCTC 9821 / NBRC 16120 / NCIMB 702349/ NCTC 13040) OX=521096 GN=Tpau_2092 PE=4 SV=1 [Tsukamurella paurometabola]|uniref:Integral membrane protein n=1 Tax=Tsukamurella paurometabola (strain ATCC 8368 / DSM 20162 / CCUG 35730 / CIP 100753 / JCM 10117 / KCTC 9821 / NBRC 16120 / NCIMB 702349 / NCTC 13040) TaxID=521096 RepID=D5UPE8_TSUPD|nr:hypothetical protein [Tsukamurella paurometabola]ADG78704.1 conserved hypothetical protein [Tsukamurella paurometabola DSM 20162]SUP32813.1 Uncharacterised protein [Tsukamurella paurometabola]
MTAAVIVVLLIAAAAGVVAARAGTDGKAGLIRATVPLLLLAAAAILALAAPATTGFGLAAVRVAAVIAAMAGGSVLVTATFALAGANGRADESVPVSAAAPETDESPAAENGETVEEPLRGGLAIGILERAAIAVCILANFAAGLAVIVAAKGLARYPELRNPGAAEQFIIGTFVSVLWAAGCAGVAVAISR